MTKLSDPVRVSWPAPDPAYSEDGPRKSHGSMQHDWSDDSLIYRIDRIPDVQFCVLDGKRGVPPAVCVSSDRHDYCCEPMLTTRVTLEALDGRIWFDCSLNGCKAPSHHSMSWDNLLTAIEELWPIWHAARQKAARTGQAA